MEQQPTVRITASDDVLQDSKQFLRSQEICRTNFQNRTFYRCEGIKDWMLPRSGRLLSAVFSDGKWPSIQASGIFPDNWIIFAILIDMNCGHLIRHFVSVIGDSYLTISNLSSYYKSITDKRRSSFSSGYEIAVSQAIIQDFDERRWAFVPVPIRFEMSSSLPEKCILPFFHMETIKEGGTAEVFHCKIQADLVDQAMAQALAPSLLWNQDIGDVFVPNGASK